MRRLSLTLPLSLPGTPSAPFLDDNDPGQGDRFQALVTMSQPLITIGRSPKGVGGV